MALESCTGEFDLVFVDANKAEYKRYIEVILEKNLLSAGGVIVCDNVLYNGYPYVHQHFDAQPARRHFGDAIKELVSRTLSPSQICQQLFNVQ